MAEQPLTLISLGAVAGIIAAVGTMIGAVINWLDKRDERREAAFEAKQELIQKTLAEAQATVIELRKQREEQVRATRMALTHIIAAIREVYGLPSPTRDAVMAELRKAEEVLRSIS